MFHRMEIISCISVENKVKGKKNDQVNFLSSAFLQITACWTLYI